MPKESPSVARNKRKKHQRTADRIAQKKTLSKNAERILTFCPTAEVFDELKKACPGASTKRIKACLCSLAGGCEEDILKERAAAVLERLQLPEIERKETKNEPDPPENSGGMLTHADPETVSPAMVDISSKPVTARSATAVGRVLLPPRTRELLLENATKERDVLGVAQIAGIAAAKRTSSLVPLCHLLAITHASVDLEVARDEPPRIDVRASVRADGKTGVEMEALCAVSVAALTVYDMCKAAGQEGLEITGIKVVEKAGGVSGNWKR